MRIFVFKNVSNGTFWFSYGLFSFYLCSCFCNLICTSTYFSITRETYRSNICYFRTFCYSWIDNNSTFMMVVSMYVIGGATLLFADPGIFSQKGKRLNESGSKINEVPMIFNTKLYISGIIHTLFPWAADDSYSTRLSSRWLQIFIRWSPLTCNIQSCVWTGSFCCGPAANWSSRSTWPAA